MHIAPWGSRSLVFAFAGVKLLGLLGLLIVPGKGVQILFRCIGVRFRG
jgi:hypothetical protein